MMSFPEKKQTYFKDLDTFENYLNVSCTIDMMNTELCVFYIEIQSRNATKEKIEETEISLRSTKSIQ